SNSRWPGDTPGRKLKALHKRNVCRGRAVERLKRFLKRSESAAARRSSPPLPGPRRATARWPMPEDCRASAALELRGDVIASARDHLCELRPGQLAGRALLYGLWHGACDHDF